MSLCDTLLRPTSLGLYRAHWSDLILEEVERNLGTILQDPTAAHRRVAAMRTAFTRATVTGFEPLIERMPNQAKYRHVLAAAVVSGAEVIVTFNLRHFRTSGTSQSRIQAQHPDDFLSDLFDR